MIKMIFSDKDDSEAWKHQPEHNTMDGCKVLGEFLVDGEWERLPRQTDISVYENEGHGYKSAEISALGLKYNRITEAEKFRVIVQHSVKIQELEAEARSLKDEIEEQASKNPAVKVNVRISDHRLTHQTEKTVTEFKINSHSVQYDAEDNDVATMTVKVTNAKTARELPTEFGV